MSNDVKGTIFANYSICCGICEFEQALNAKTRRDATKEAINLMWVLTKEYGWCCYICAPRQKKLEGKYGV